MQFYDLETKTEVVKVLNVECFVHLSESKYLFRTRTEDEEMFVNTEINLENIQDDDLPYVINLRPKDEATL